jgi:MFS transporter, NNP family, nitrate/nitrite transporter
LERHHDLRGRAILFVTFFWLLWFMNFGVRIIFAPILPLIEDEFLISHAKASGVFVFHSIGYGISLMLSGFFCSRFGYKKSIAVSLGISSLIFFCIPFVKVFSVLYVFSFMLGFSIGLYLPSAIPLLTEYFAEKDWGKVLPIHDSGSSVSIFCMPFIALFLLPFVGWRGIFAVFAVAFLACAAVLPFLIDEVKVAYSQKRVFSDTVRMKSLWVLSILWVMASGATLGVYYMFPLYLTKELSMSIGYANTILGVSRIGLVIVAVGAGFIIDRLNLQKTLFLIMITTGALTILLGLASGWLISVLLFLQALCIIGFFPVGLVCLARIFSRERRSLATGIIMTTSTVFGSGMVPYLLGLSGDYISFRVGFVLLGVLVAALSFLPFSLKEIRQ